MMKKCPECGYEPTPSSETLRKRYAKYFPDMPILEMSRRQWIQVNNPADLNEVLSVLMKFFRCKTLDEFKTEFGYEGELMDF